MTKRVFILGAGFSKQAGMPLATELTKCLLDKSEFPNTQEMLAWIENMTSRIARVENAGEDFQLNIEQLFAFAKLEAERMRLMQQLCPVGRSAGETPWDKAESIETWLGYLEWNVLEVIWKKQKAAKLSPISRFVQHLSPTDTVVTFNYDTLVETALASYQQSWSHGLLDDGPEKVSVLKMHGSIDWLVMERGEGNPEKTVLLFSKKDANISERDLVEGSTGDREFQYELYGVRNADDLNFAIENRDFNNRFWGMVRLGDDKPLHRVPGLGLTWSKAFGALAEADEIYIVGFSMSPYDSMVKFHFASVMAERAKPPSKIVLVDPLAEEMKVRFETVFGSVEPHGVPAEEFDWAANLSDSFCHYPGKVLGRVESEL